MALFKKPSTLEEVKRAYENLSEEDKKSFHQSIADRVHESVAAQEREHGQEDSQSAEAREHEALGEEHAEGKGETEELHEQDDTAEEQREDSDDENREQTAESEDKAEAEAPAEKVEESENFCQAQRHYLILSAVFCSLLLRELCYNRSPKGLIAEDA